MFRYTFSIVRGYTSLYSRPVEVLSVPISGTISLSRVSPRRHERFFYACRFKRMRPDPDNVAGLPHDFRFKPIHAEPITVQPHSAVHGGVMKKVSIAVLVALISMVSISASACPSGTHPVGGVGSHHKGGTCK